jgi:uncharacterized protein with GYD domain
MMTASYTVEGLKGLLKEGGSMRRDAVEKALGSLGGTLEAYYYAFGDADLFIITDLPDNVRATAASLIGNAAGTSKIKMTVLITPEEVDKATEVAKEMSSAYRPPGQ